MNKSRVFIKVKLENKLNILDTGYLKADYLLNQLIENEHITKIKDNVMLRISNLSYDGIEIESACLDIENEFVILNLKEKLIY